MPNNIGPMEILILSGIGMLAVVALVAVGVLLKRSAKKRPTNV